MKKKNALPPFPVGQCVFLFTNSPVCALCTDQALGAVYCILVTGCLFFFITPCCGSC